MYNTIIIGSGISGIFTLKHLLEEGENNIIVLDKNPEMFGVWNRNNTPSVFDDTYTVSSKLYMTISDFPLPKEMPEFPHHSLILNYYKEYAKHFNLIRYVQQNTSVNSIKKIDNLWRINTNRGTYECKNVVIATGTVNDCPNIPNDNFYKKFTGTMMHSNEFDTIKNVINKKILIVGGSDTAVDCALFLKDNNNITVSIKNGVWFQNRNLGAYEPADMLYNRSIDFLLKNIFQKKFMTKRIDPYKFNNVQFVWGEGGSGIDIWKPKCEYLNSYYVKSRDIIDQIAKGTIEPQNEIINIDKQNITFKSGKTESYDIILFCTGYKPLKCMNFLQHDIIDSIKYKHIFCINDPTVSFVGFIRPYLTSIPMISEMQSRWIAKYICGKCNLPSQQIMKKESIQDDKKQEKEFPCSYNRLKTIIDPYDYMNMVSYKIGADINILIEFIKDPDLVYSILFDSYNHHVYRLNDTTEKRNIAIENIKEISKLTISKKIKNVFYRSFMSYVYIIIFSIILIFLLYKLFITNKNDIKKLIKMFKKIKLMFK
uniref:Flavin-containing monooxygenase n=1 Tax=viral metagenome TaxID=1070528 RepID=A0A6C0D1G3_9ZZZZ